MIFGLKHMGKLDTPKAQGLDRTNDSHGPQTQTYGETRYSKSLSTKQNKCLAWSLDSNLWETRYSQSLSTRQNQDLAQSSDSNLWGSQTFQKASVLDRTKVQDGPWTQTYRETSHSRSLSVRQVLHGPRTQTYGETSHSKSLSARQNQCLAWSSNSNLWRNQTL